jgi:hypothetical protein
MKSKDLIVLKKFHKRKFTEQFLDLLSDPAGYMQAFVSHELQTFHLEGFLDVEVALESVYVLGLQTIEQGAEIANPSVWVRKTIHRMLLIYYRQLLGINWDDYFDSGPTTPILPETPPPLESGALRSDIFVSPEQP